MSAENISYDLKRFAGIKRDYTDEDVERLMVLSGVRQFPVRVKCATLAWHTMDAALKGASEISTER